VRLIILLAMLTIALPFIISQAAMPYGVAVSMRFLERPTNSENPKYTIPTESDKAVDLTGDSLSSWMQAKADDWPKDTQRALSHSTYSICF
jgi:hypothetical protein